MVQNNLRWGAHINDFTCKLAFKFAPNKIIFITKRNTKILLQGMDFYLLKLGEGKAVLNSWKSIRAVSWLLTESCNRNNFWQITLDLIGRVLDCKPFYTQSLFSATFLPSAIPTHVTLCYSSASLSLILNLLQSDHSIGKVNSNQFLFNFIIYYLVWRLHLQQWLYSQPKTMTLLFILLVAIHTFYIYLFLIPERNPTIFQRWGKMYVYYKNRTN